MTSEKPVVDVTPEVIGEPNILSQRLAALRRQGKTIGLVPTMGALHEGHLSLVRRSRQMCDVTAVSIFVNPTQFAPGEDYEKYPRVLEADLEALASAGGADFVLAPSPAAMYPEGFDAHVHIGGVTKRLEGECRPTHFDGVAVVVLKLFNMSGADVAFFGQKDYQQAAVIQKMVRDLNLQVKIEVCPIVREADGLAMSSRNKYLSAEERAQAPVLKKALDLAKEQIEAGNRDTADLKHQMRRLISAVPSAAIDYISIADPATLEELDSVGGPAVILLAVKIGATRLIDNIVIP
ncbi:MAG: pantoate--beta-alanine ligase [Thermoguttaceae bacterium]|nr:pantoate--beta-alanine ligase [Thermoguttaceae bacterium]